MKKKLTTIKYKRCLNEDVNNLSIVIISQDYYELPKRTMPANGNIYHIFKPNNFRDVQISIKIKLLWT